MLFVFKLTLACFEFRSQSCCAEKEIMAKGVKFAVLLAALGVCKGETETLHAFRCWNATTKQELSISDTNSQRVSELVTHFIE